MSLESYILETSTVISGQVQTYDRVHSEQIYSAVPQGDQMSHTQSHYRDIERTSLCPRLGSDKYQFSKLMV